MLSRTRRGKGSKQAQSVVDIELCGAPAENLLVDNCKAKIHAAFFGSRLSLKNARTAISDFRKASRNKERIAELMLFYVECGIEFINMYGDVDEAFYSNIASMFSDFVDALNRFDSNAYYHRNAERILQVCQNADCVVWGFPEELWDIYNEIRRLMEMKAEVLKITTQALYQNLGGYMVEARGVEPLSEDSATRASPSAVCVLKFPHARAHRQARAIGSFMNPTCGKAYAGWFPTLMTPSTRAVGSPGSTGGIKPRPARSWNRCYSQLLFFPLLRGSGPRLASRTTDNPRRNQYAPV